MTRPQDADDILLSWGALRLQNIQSADLEVQVFHLSMQSCPTCPFMHRVVVYAESERFFTTAWAGIPNMNNKDLDTLRSFMQYGHDQSHHLYCMICKAVVKLQ